MISDKKQMRGFMGSRADSRDNGRCALVARGVQCRVRNLTINRSPPIKPFWLPFSSMAGWAFFFFLPFSKFAKNKQKQTLQTKEKTHSDPIRHKESSGANSLRPNRGSWLYFPCSVDKKNTYMTIDSFSAGGRLSSHAHVYLACGLKAVAPFGCMKS